ncbi:MAG: hypothetical protein G01um101430_389 [Parcubacteria group bacterium Gr01-1014_30]|nr:MAG: hypothetical protein G01um101430_389 [Parcubacteria group bacterium Gr01-1014_30]
MNGYNHFTKTDMIAGYAKSKNIPSPRLSVLVSGAMLFLGGLGIILGIYIELSVSLLVIFLLAAAFSIHTFWSLPPEQKMMDMMLFMRNLALTGALLMLLELSTPWVWSLAF